MRWAIVTDSSCDLLPSPNNQGEVRCGSVPFVIRVGERDFVDDEALDLPEMVDAMEQEAHASHTSCPSPEAWLKQFEQADCIVAITISSQLSGSMNSACVARDMAKQADPNKKIAVVDSRSTGPELVLCVQEILRLIREGKAFQDVVSYAESFFRKAQIAFALCSFNNLIKNGRLGKVAGFLAKKLKLWGIGIGSEEGEIEVVGKVRGQKKALARLLADMHERGFQGGKAAISHCLNPSFAMELKERIVETWPGTAVEVMSTRGLCGYYAERGGVIVSFVG